MILERLYRPLEKFSARMHPFILRILHMSLILVAILLDPLFYYIPVVNNDSNCLGVDNTLRIIVVVVRSFVDVAFMISWWYTKTYQNILSFMAAIIAILPLPQVIVYAVSWRLLTVRLLKFVVLIQFVPWVYLTIATYKISRKCFRGCILSWFSAAFYLFMFIIASNVLGAFWYLRAIERNMDCWRKACKMRPLCSVSSLYCDGNLSNNSYLDEFCLIPAASNSTFFDPGIYLDAFQRKIIRIHTKFTDKFFHCLWWGLQSLSSLGQNLEPGSYIWDNVFAIFIVISGLILLASLIGTMQVYIQKETVPDMDKQEKLKILRKQMRSWPPFYMLPENLRREILKCRDQKWLETTDVNVETLLNNFRHERLPELKLLLCRDLFSKVENFANLPLNVKTELKELARPVVFQERSIIYMEGHPIYEMIYIVSGKVLAFSKDNNTKKYHKRKDFIGKELLEKVLESTEPDLPLATETVQTMTKVEAFTLSLDHFIGVFTRSGNLIPAYKERWAANAIAEALRKRRNSKKIEGNKKIEQAKADDNDIESGVSL